MLFSIAAVLFSCLVIPSVKCLDQYLEDRLSDPGSASTDEDWSEDWAAAEVDLEECSVPNILNGNIKQKVEGLQRFNFETLRFESQVTYKIVDVGSVPSPTASLSLVCHDGYFIQETSESSAHIQCFEGEWFPDPVCLKKRDIKCPLIDQAEDFIIVYSNEREIDSTAHFSCKDSNQGISGDFETRTCLSTGEWSGENPKCEDRCGGRSQERLPELSEIFAVISLGIGLGFQCLAEFQARPVMPVCLDEAWIQKLVSLCRRNICNGRSPTHIPEMHVIHDVISSGVDRGLQCVAAFGQTKVCLDGAWLHNLLTLCKESDTKHNPAATQTTTEGIRSPVRKPVPADSCSCEHTLTDENVVAFADGKEVKFHGRVKHGVILKFRCRNVRTYQLFGPQEIRCQNCHPWSTSDFPYCSKLERGDCLVPSILKGSIVEQNLSHRLLNWHTKQYQTTQIYENVPVGSAPTSNSTLYLLCRLNYLIQDLGVFKTRITCSDGKWSPTPVCKEISSMKEHKPEATISGEAEGEECSCKYTVKDAKLVAHADGKLVRHGDWLEEGSVLKLRCNKTGFHRLIGQKEITCEDCEPWHFTEFPKCVSPEIGDTIVKHERNVNISSTGDYEVHEGQTVRFICYAYKTSEFPLWSVPNESGVSEYHEVVIKDRNFFLSHLEIENITSQNAGSYACSSEKQPPIIVELHVKATHFPAGTTAIAVSSTLSPEESTTTGRPIIPTIPKPADKCACTYNSNDWLLVAVVKGERLMWGDKVQDRESFDLRCRIRSMQLVLTNGTRISGSIKFTCDVCQTWKDNDLPHCQYTIPATPLPDGNTAIVTPSTQSTERSTATRYKTTPVIPTVPKPADNCFCTYNSNDRSLSAAVNGIVLWSGDKVREGETPELSCSDRSMQLVLPNATRISGSMKLTCNACQTWEDTDLPSCQAVIQDAFGCHLDVQAVSRQLIIEPVKEFFSLGEVIILSCPLDQELTVNVGKIMCIGTSWSNEFPGCQPRKKH